MVACPVVTSPPARNRVIARLSTSFLPHRQFAFPPSGHARLEAGRAAAEGADRKIVVMRAYWALAATLVVISACAPAAPAPSATTPAPRQQPEAEAWAEVRSNLLAAPLIIPTWLPASLDRARVEVRGIGHGPDPADPVYRLAYVAPAGGTVLFALGPASDIPGSALGTRVRNSPAVLSFPSSLWSQPTKPAPHRIRWQEDRYVLSIESADFTGEDLLHIAWSLDHTGAPAPKKPYTRVKPGVCAARGGSGGHGEAPYRLRRRRRARCGDGLLFSRA